MSDCRPVKAIFCLAILAVIVAVGSAGLSALDGGYLGVQLEEESEGTNGAMIHDVEAGSPADKAGLKGGLRVVKCNGKAIANSTQFIEILKGSAPGTSLRLIVENPEGWQKPVEVTLGGQKAVAKKPYLGIQIEETERGVRVAVVQPGSPADRAGLKTGDLIVAIGDKRIRNEDEFAAIIGAQSPGSRLKIRVERSATIEATLGAREEGRSTPAAQVEEKKAVEKRAEEVRKAVEEDQKVLEERKKAEARAKKPGWLGVRLQAQEEGGSLEILSVLDGSPAKKAGLKDGDVIVEMEGQAVRGFEGLGRALRNRYAGDTVKIVIERDGMRMTLELVLGERR